MSTDQPTPAAPASGLPTNGTVLATALADATPQIKTAWLDRIPAAYRHFLLLVISMGLADGAHYINSIHLTTAQATAAGLGLTFATEYFTPLTRQFGVGK